MYGEVRALGFQTRAPFRPGRVKGTAEGGQPHMHACCGFLLASSSHISPGGAWQWKVGLLTPPPFLHLTSTPLQAQARAAAIAAWGGNVCCGVLLLCSLLLNSFAELLTPLQCPSLSFFHLPTLCAPFSCRQRGKSIPCPSCSSQQALPMHPASQGASSRPLGLGPACTGHPCLAVPL